MANHHDHHSSEEKKPVAFTVPFILATVTLIAMLLLLSLCDPKHHGKCECTENCSTECMEACEKGDHSKHPPVHGVDHSMKTAPEERAPENHIAPGTNTTDTVKTEAHAADTTKAKH